MDELVRSREPLARLPGARKAHLLDPAVDITAPGTLCRSCAARILARRHLGVWHPLRPHACRERACMSECAAGALRGRWSPTVC